MQMKSATRIATPYRFFLLIVCCTSYVGRCDAQSETTEFSRTSHTYKTVDSIDIEADVYRFQDAVRRPVMVWIHGGALLIGSRDGVPKQLLDLARQEKYVLVSLDYRLGPQAKLWEIIEDVNDGLRWIRDLGSEKFGADPSRMVVTGASAGGYLALMSGLTTPPPSAIVSYWGFGDVDGEWTTKPSQSYHQGKLIDKKIAWAGAGEKILTRTNQENGRGRSTFFLYLKQTGGWLQALTGLDPLKDRDKITPFCPVRNVSKAYPPTLFLHGTADKDVPVEQSIAMARELNRHAVPNELITIEGGGHSLWGGDLKEIDKAFARSVEYIREVFSSEAER